MLMEARSHERRCSLSTLFFITQQKIECLTQSEMMTEIRERERGWGGRGGREGGKGREREEGREREGSEF